MDADREIVNITKFLKDFIANKTAVIGLSGGIDSAVTLVLVRKALPSFKILAVFMPSDTTPEQDFNDVNNLAIITGVKLETVDITPIVAQFQKALSASDISALGNIKARIRMSILYYYSNIRDALVIGTTNKTESILGYYTKFGDGACDVEPIIHLLKRDVRSLAVRLSVPESIINKKPSAGLWSEQSDESELGMTYEQMDQSIEKLFVRHETPTNDIDIKILEMYKKTMHKRILPVSLEEEK